MKRSTERILTTHTGSLPRPAELVDMLHRRDEGQDIPQSAVDACAHTAVAEVVAKQCDAGVDVINDGEQGKIAYSVYVKDRLSGFDGEEPTQMPALDDDFPEYSKRMQQAEALILLSSIKRPVCTGPIGWKDHQAVQKDIDKLKAALNGFAPEDVFMTAASPGVVSGFLQDQYYDSEEAYVFALADALKVEYDAIFRAGFLLQVDCPDLTMSGLRRGQHTGHSQEDFIKKAELHVEALNHAVRDIPPDRMRLHLCWGNYEGPHHLDTPLKDIIGIAFKARPSALSFEASNPRHGHEWKLFKEVKLPEGKLLIPGVLDSTTNFIEHPELVQQRIVQYASLVGRENVIAGTDCGFAHFASSTPRIDPRIAWAKLAALADGAHLASEELW